jgi:hypothetical protein
MAEGRKRRIGAVGIVLGLLLSGLGLVAAVAPATALADTTGLVCNNQKDRADQDCEGANNHGTISTSFDGSGNLLFDIDANPGFGGWKQIYICIPGTDKTNSADCQGNTASVLNPQTSYDVTTPSTNTEGTKDVSFACSTSINATVLKSALPASGPVKWTVHVNTCGGGTDEAFGTSTPTPPPGPNPQYLCQPATGVSQTGATLNGSTDDADVTRAIFTFTQGSSATFEDTSSAAGAFSAAATGLTANTVYKYKVEFFEGANTTAVGTATDCAFQTSQKPPTYACEAATNVTSTSATLNGSTDDDEVDAATFVLSPAEGTVAAGTETGNSNKWSAAASSLKPGTDYTYTVQFKDGTDVAGTSASCAFTTGPAVLGVTQEQPAAPAPATAAVAPAAAAAPQTAAAAAAAPATLPRTGLANDLLAPLGAALVLVGVAFVLLGRREQLALLERPAGQHYRS